MIYEKKQHCVCFVAGKSGGHIIPALTLASRLKKENASTNIMFFTTESPLDASIIGRDATVDDHQVLTIGALTGWYSVPLVIVRMIVSFVKCFYRLLKQGPTEIISMGGLVSIPVVCAAWIIGIPVTLYEVNAIPGKAVKMLSYFSKRINVCFDSVRSLLPRYKICRVDYPVRFGTNDRMHKEAARKQLHLSNDESVLLILGGSQGSKFLNTFAESYIRYRIGQPSSSKLVIIHQAGQHDREGLDNFYRSLGITCHVFAYQHDLAPYYAATDIAIARAGAGTIFELQFFGVKSLLIPLEATTTDHQLDNAYAIAAQRSDLFSVARQSVVAEQPESVFRYLDQLL